MGELKRRRVVMGAIMKYICKCGYEEKLFIGCGLAYKNKSIIKENIPAEEYARFEEALSEGEAEDYCFSNAVISCDDCHKLYNVSDFSYSDNDETIRYTEPCPECGLECEPLPDTESILCPKCGAEMTGEETGHWD